MEAPSGCGSRWLMLCLAFSQGLLEIDETLRPPSLLALCYTEVGPSLIRSQGSDEGPLFTPSISRFIWSHSSHLKTLI